MDHEVDTTNPAFRHGHAGSKRFSPTYQSWACMLQRATNPKRAFAYCYVDRGIGVCAEWLTFTAFLRDMGERPVGTTLDRIDYNKGYEPGNCRWVDALVQANNKRTNRQVTIDGETLSVTQWCRRLNKSPNTVWARINKWGYTPEEAILSPPQDRVRAAKEMTAKRVHKNLCEQSGK